MENLFFSLKCVLPLFVLISVGYLLRRRGLISGDFVSVGSNIVFKLALPVQLFLQMAGSALSTSFNPSLILFALVSNFLLVAILWVTVPRLVPGRASQGAVIQGLFRGNFALLGVPLAINIFGQEGAAPASMLLAIVIPFYNVMAVVVLTIFSEDNESEKKIPLKKIFLRIAKNPLIIGILLGALWQLGGLPLPEAFVKCLTPIAQLTTPLALICLGGQFSFQVARNNLRISLPVTILKLAGIPAVMLSVAVWLGFRGTELGAVFVLYSAPTAVSSYVMAKNMGSDDDLAAQILVFTTIFSSVSLLLILTVLKGLGLV